MCQIKHSFLNFLPSPFKIGFRKHFPKEMNFAYLCKDHIALSVWHSSFLNSKMFKWWAESPNEKSIVGPFLSIQWKFIYGCKKEINQAQWKCSSQTISVQGDSAPPTSQVGDLFKEGWQHLNGHTYSIYEDYNIFVMIFLECTCSW